MRSFTLRTSWKKPETLRTLRVRRRAAGIVRLAGIGLGVRGVRRVGAKVVGKGAESAVDGDVGMGAIGIVDRVRR
jgi:hypothetical protein